jgi:hypothetical protein
LDVGFANINKYQPGDYPGIIVWRVKSQDKLTITSTFFKVIPLLESEPLAGKLWIVDENKVRIRD